LISLSCGYKRETIVSTTYLIVSLVGDDTKMNALFFLAPCFSRLPVSMDLPRSRPAPALTVISVLFCCILALLPMFSTLADEVVGQAAEEAGQTRGGESDERVVIGWVEKVVVGKEDLHFHARMDPGRTASTLHAEEMSIRRRSGQEVVSFLLKDRYGHSHKFEKPLLRRIQLRDSRGNVREAPVVQLSLCIAGRYAEDEIILSDRSKLSHEMLIGRQTLEEHFLIDPSRTFSVEPSCPEDQRL
jgi:hypothetical protein